MDDWQYEPLQGLPPDALATNSRLMNALRDRIYMWMLRWLKTRFGFQVEGADIFQRLQHFVLIANHSSHLDTICLLAAMPANVRNKCYSAAAEDYFYTHLFKEQFARLIANTFPFRRRGDVVRSLAASARILERGDSLIFYPEGTRSTPGAIQPFRKGIGLLVQGKPYAVLPAFITGTHDALAKGRCIPRTTRIEVRIGSPESFQNAPLGDNSAAEIANRLHSRVCELGQLANSTK